MVISSVKRGVRHVVSRVLDPHLAWHADDVERRVGRQLDARSGPALDPILTDFNQLLHELRTIELRRLPVNGGVLLSAGCAGAWYFDWMERCAGPFRRHIGVELYSVEPPGLPGNVTWIAESASSMPGVADASVDVVFSGQNIEHLWSDDMVGFLLESHRVLRPGGVLVVDSPNRTVVEALGWAHPEHTIELTVGEASELFELAGFTPRQVRGLWSCRDGRTGSWLPLAAGPGDARAILERCSGRAPVDDCFVWWIEAERTGSPDESALRQRVDELFAAHWNGRVNRAPETSAGSEPGDVVYRTQVFPLFAGRYAVTASDPDLRVRLEASDGSTLGEGLGSTVGELDRTAFGVRAELSLVTARDEADAKQSVVVDLWPVPPGARSGPPVSPA